MHSRAYIHPILEIYINYTNTIDDYDQSIIRLHHHYHCPSCNSPLSCWKPIIILSFPVALGRLLPATILSLPPYEHKKQSKNT